MGQAFRSALLAVSFFLPAGLVKGSRVFPKTPLEEASAEPGADTVGAPGKPSFRLAGVPIYGAQPMPRMRLAPGRPKPAREWIVVLKPDSTDDEVGSICSGKASCPQGHPSAGGVPFAEVTLSDDDLEAVLTKHPGRVDFVEADLPVSVIPEMPKDITPRVPEENISQRRRELNGGSLLQASWDWPWAPSPSPWPWGIEKVGADEGRGRGRGVHVYVLDTGIRTTHHEFGGRAIPTLETHAGWVKVCHPRDAHCAQDLDGHGTHCAATVAGDSTGVASGAYVHAVKCMGDDGKGETSNVLMALDWIMWQGPRPAVVSMSLGHEGRLEAYDRGIAAAIQRGITVVVAAGNEDDDACSHSPSYSRFAITVGATTITNRRSSFSNFGSCVDIFAPGSDVLSASHENDEDHVEKDGTSMAAPHVAGAAAWLLEGHRHWGANDVMMQLQRSGEHDEISDVRGASNLLLMV